MGRSVTVTRFLTALYGLSDLCYMFNILVQEAGIHYVKSESCFMDVISFCVALISVTIERNVSSWGKMLYFACCGLFGFENFRQMQITSVGQRINVFLRCLWLGLVDAFSPLFLDPVLE